MSCKGTLQACNVFVQSGVRTGDLLIRDPALYQLSYSGEFWSL